ncbi:hypothetical protein IMZ29_00775 [Achromobacter sp. GG226]|uniref:hypothetical protein n=1 Tax=Verticiella alkaliphila TaxID=2779529 RepID=UPI001C0BD40A|nr:hypothetical protein [Verticiella sp. GG226]MBU4609136.1 hypothetical protein [Verticiella sp. GG226]
MSLSFGDQVSAWARESVERLTAVRRRSIEMLGDEMATTKPQGGRVPFQSGNLARSLLASTEGMPKTSENPTAGSNVGVVTATLDLSQPIWIGYQAIYARRMNYGYVGADALGRVFNQSGHYFVEGAIESWLQIVAQAAQEVQSASMK